MKLIILVFTYIFMITTLNVDFLGIVSGVEASFSYFFNLFPDLAIIKTTFSYVIKIFQTPMMLLVLSFGTIYFVMRITIGG